MVPGRPSEATGGFEPPHKGFADLSLTTWVRRRGVHLPPDKQNPATWWDWGRRGHFLEEVYLRNLRCDYRTPPAPKGRAGNGIRTRDINLGKVALYQLSYSRIGGGNIINSRRLSKLNSQYSRLPSSYQCVRLKYTSGDPKSQDSSKILFPENHIRIRPFEDRFISHMKELTQKAHQREGFL